MLWEEKRKKNMDYPCVFTTQNQAVVLFCFTHLFTIVDPIRH